MGLASLAAFIAAMWLMILGLVAFLVAIVSPVDRILDQAKFTRLEISIIEAAIAIVAVIAVILGLSRMKRLYLQLRLGN